MGFFLQYKLSKEKQVKILQTEQRKASKDPKNRFSKKVEHIFQVFGEFDIQQISCSFHESFFSSERIGIRMLDVGCWM